MPTPWIAPDEMVYGLLGRGLYEDGSLTVLGGPSPYYSAVVPALVGLPLRAEDLALGYSALKVVQAFVMSVAALPAYLWARTLTGRGWALAAATLTLAIPSLAYSGLVMTEVVFYPLFLVAAWSMSSAIAAPTRLRQAAFVGALCLAVATRIQAVVLVPAFVSAVVLAALLDRREHGRRGIVAHIGRALAGVGLSLASVGVLALAWIAGRAATGGSLLAGYREAGGSYEAGPAARFVGYHAGDVVLLTGLFPVAALIVLVWTAARRGEEDARARAFLATAASVVLWLVLEVGVFASRELGLLAERNLVAAAPLLFIAFALWLGRGCPGGYAARAVAAFAAGTAVLALPLGDLVVPEALPHAFTLVSLLDLREATSLATLELATGIVVALGVLLFCALPRRALPVLAVLLLLALASASVSASREVASQSRAQQERLLGPDRRWIDHAADGLVAYVYDGQAYWNAVWENLFWNRRIGLVYDLPGTLVPGPLPQQPVDVRPSGELRPGGELSPARFAVVPSSFTLRGAQVASAPQFGTDRQGLALWRLEPPLRLSTITSGVFGNGDVDRVATVTAYDCRDGAFDAVLLVKEPQTVRVYVDGRAVRRASFDGTATWRLRIRPGEAADDGVCKLKIVPGGLLGSTRLSFER